MEASSESTQKCVLTIAGSDPSGGAGIQADIKTISYLGAYAAAVPTALTIQNTQTVESVEALSPELVFKQIKCVFDDIKVDAVKLGLIPNAGVLEAICMVLEQSATNIPIVCDPVLKSSSGLGFFKVEQSNYYLERLMPLTTLMTPNLYEAGIFLDNQIINEDMMVDAAMQLAAKGNTAVLVTGGDLEGNVAADVLFCDGIITRFSAPRIKSKNTHGTGCALSSAIATFLAQGLLMKDAVDGAREFVRHAIETAPRIGQGHGPLNYLHP